MLREEGYIAYKPKKDITEDFDDDELKEFEEQTKASGLVKCDRCGLVFDSRTFNFSKRGYFKEVHDETKFSVLCEKCYRDLKKMFLEMRAKQQEARSISDKMRVGELNEV